MVKKMSRMRGLKRGGGMRYNGRTKEKRLMR